MRTMREMLRDREGLEVALLEALVKSAQEAFTLTEREAIGTQEEHAAAFKKHVTALMVPVAHGVAVEISSLDQQLNTAHAFHEVMVSERNMERYRAARAEEALARLSKERG